MPIKKARAKKLCECWVFSFLCIFRGFLLLTFVRGISESRHQRIWNQLLRFSDTHIDIFQEKKFLGHYSTFCILQMQMRKNCTFSISFSYLSIYVWFLLKFQKKYKVEASLSPRRNWDSPTPSVASECAPPPGTKEGVHTRLRVRGWGIPVPTAGEKA